MNHPLVQAGLGEAIYAGAARRLRRAGLAVLLALSSLLPLHVSAADLLSLFQLATERDPVLKGTQAGLRATLEAFPQARAGLLPSVGITANVARNFQQHDAARGDPAVKYGRGLYLHQWRLQPET